MKTELWKTSTFRKHAKHNRHWERKPRELYQRQRRTSFRNGEIQKEGEWLIVSPSAKRTGRRAPKRHHWIWLLRGNE